MSSSAYHTGRDGGDGGMGDAEVYGTTWRRQGYTARVTSLVKYALTPALAA